MVTLLTFNVKMGKSILKYFIAEGSSNVTILDRWQNQLVQNSFWRSGSAAAKWVILHREETSIRFKMATSRFLSIEKTKPTRSSITVNCSLIPFIWQGMKNLDFSNCVALLIITKSGSCTCVHDTILLSG